MYSDHIEKYFEALIPSFEQYLMASAKNDAKFSLKGPAELAASLIHHYRQDLERLHPKGTMSAAEVGNHIKDYALLNRVVNLLKHPSEAKADPLINKRDQIFEAMVINAFPHDNGPYMYSHMRIAIHLNSGVFRDLLEVVTNVLNGWGSFLIANNQIKKEEARFYRYTGDDFLTSEQANLIPDPRVNFTPGKEFNLALLPRGYNFKTRSFDIVSFQST